MPVARVDRTRAVVVAVAALALATRLYALGSRPFHWDEARVGYWTLRYLETGAFTYRPVAGGPLLYHVDRHLFALLGPSDAVARLPVAVAGGLLPLTALLLRGRLDDVETVVLAVLLTANPLLVYYSRFLRGDVVAVGAAVVAVAAAVRAYDDDGRYAYLTAVSGASAPAASGFAVAYPLALLVAGALVLDHDRLLGRAGTGDRLDAVLDRVRSARRTTLGAVGLFAVTLVYLFAPRSGTGPGPGLWRPSTLPAVVREATAGAVRAFVGVRVVDRRPSGTHELLPFLAGNAEALAAGALPLVALALLALLHGRYTPGGPRPVPSLFAYWGLSGLLLFPVVSETSAPWVAVHSVVPLAVPAAVGGATVLRFGADAFDRRRTRDVAATGLLVGAVVLQTGAVAVGGVYAPPTPESGLASYGQPADDLDPFARNVSATTGTGSGGTDLLYYGDRFVVANEEQLDAPPVPDAFGERLPLAWYDERAGSRTDNAVTPEALDDPPPVVVTVPERRAEVARRLDGYAVRQYRTALWNRRVVVFVGTT